MSRMSQRHFMLTIFFIWHYSPPVGQGLLIHEVSRPQSVGLLWTSDELVAETKTTLTTDRHPCLLWDSNPQSSEGERLQTHALDRTV